MTKPQNTGFKRVWKAMLYSFAGFRAAWQGEAAFRQEMVLVIFLTPIGLWLGTTATQRALLLGSCMLVLIVELLNSAVEAVVDRVGTDRHILSGRAKDMGSAAVFVSLATVVLIWGLIAWERFFASAG